MRRALPGLESDCSPRTMDTMRGHRQGDEDRKQYSFWNTGPFHCVSAPYDLTSPTGAPRETSRSRMVIASAQ